MGEDQNGELLDLIERAGFEAFITNDKRMEREQALARRPFVTLLLSTNNWPALEPHAGKVAKALDSAQPSQAPIRVECGHFVRRRFRNSAGPQS